MTKKHPRHIAQLIGYNAADDVVYSEEISLDEYYDGEHAWDSSEGVKQVAMVKLIGKLFDDDGDVCQEFESAFSPDTGERIGGRVSHDDGQVFTDGTYTDT